ncbi:MAG: DEAD/DEAH box helicase [Acidimicrobiia bacterium]|nr:DEAD/DEAH box helicase [Acidimicrobiia bacterium]
MIGALSGFWAQVSFEPDRFQKDAAEAIASGLSVVVTAPTGAGKTLVAEAAIHIARSRGSRAFYTTPVKALSNQKFGDLTDIHGPENVGLLTGDNVINGEAPIVVMTTEVLRNMVYSSSSQLDNVSVVVLDEVHYLQDRSRGAVWEEVIIHTPSRIQLVCLSATIANNAEFSGWVEERRGPTRLVSTSDRPIPLESMYMIKDKMGSGQLHLLPTFTDRDGRRRPNPKIEHMLGLERGRRRRYKTPNRADVVERLAEEMMLPSIYFIFSRAGCDAAAQRLVDSGMMLTDSGERSAIREIVEDRTSHLEDSDLAVLGYSRFVSGLEAGVAAHHAGMVPAFKETVEELFTLGLVKVVFATETLALGINMPARSVVIESLSKFNGESHEPLRPGDYTQLTGRAGRRGIDVKGFGIVLHSPFVKFSDVVEIADVGAHELRSSFRPTYNMTANLVANYTKEEAEELLEASFATYQRGGDLDRTVASIEALEHQLAQEEDLARCDRGSVDEYLAAIEAAPPDRRRSGIGALLSPGVVIDVDGGSRDGRYAVLKRLSSKGGARYLVLSTSGRVSTLSYRQIPETSQTAGRIELSVPFKPRDRKFIQETLRKLRRVKQRRSNRSPRIHTLVEHPVAECPDAARHVAALRKARRIRRRLDQYRSSLRSTGHGLIGEFHAIQDTLGDLDYLNGWELTSRGKRLRTLYNELDLLLAETIERGLLYGLDPAELAAMVSVFVYEPRSDQPSPADWPNETLSNRWDEILEIWEELTGLETRHKLSPTRRPDPGFGRMAHQWAGGVDFDDLSIGGLAPGDFVRVSRQLSDLLRQIRDGIRELSDDAHHALVGVDRGVVAAQGIDQ